MRAVFKPLVFVAAAAHLAVAPIAYSTQSFALTGDVDLPKPYVSRALDAVLLPIDAVVRTTFALDAKDQGVLVLSVQPGGVADQQGLVPGDVLSQVRGHKIVDPIELDEVVYYWINQGSFDFSFDYYRAGVLAATTAVITLELYSEVVDVATVASWETWSTETSFSYAEFYAEYSEEITESYESSESTIEEVASAEEFTEEVTEEDASDDSVDDATDDDGTDDAADDTADDDDDGDDADDDGDTDDGDDGGDDGDDGGDDDSGGDDGGEE
ncbi:PDZ domain-containing protein [uncultured Devosia sp.]|uniref:PDZ domain-containing protein n=1 Tax=uncultured Devosia sp. TaxID=211434 RepID=UPI0035CA76D5